MFLFILVKELSVTTTGYGTFTAVCPTNYYLYYCGIDNSQTIYYDGYRYGWPVDRKTCQCQGNGGVNCIAWCRLDLLSGYEIRTNTVMGTGSVSCSSGKSTLSCNVMSNMAGVEVFRAAYPSSDGQSCICYDYFGATCSAICADYPSGYRIISIAGNGGVQVGCASGQSLYGCGIKPSKVDPFDRFSTYYATSSGTCFCSFNTGVTCYSICAY